MTKVAQSSADTSELQCSNSIPTHINCRNSESIKCTNNNSYNTNSTNNNLNNSSQFTIIIIIHEFQGAFLYCEFYKFIVNFTNLPNFIIFLSIYDI